MAKGDVVESPRLPVKGPTEPARRVFDDSAAGQLARRIELAKLDGAVNIAVGIDFLLELLQASRHAMRQAGYKSTKEI